jgi:hypothetical protein
MKKIVMFVLFVLSISIPVFADYNSDFLTITQPIMIDLKEKMFSTRIQILDTKTDYLELIIESLQTKKKDKSLEENKEYAKKEWDKSKKVSTAYLTLGMFFSLNSKYVKMNVPIDKMVSAYYKVTSYIYMHNDDDDNLSQDEITTIFEKALE